MRLIKLKSWEAQEYPVKAFCILNCWITAAGFPRVAAAIP